MSKSPPLDPLFLQLQTHLAGRFSFERELGRGGMGVVYLARDVALDRPVAIKVLAPALAARTEMRARFLREARIAAQCFHPHIVPIHAVEEANDLAWIVMSYVRGETLADRLRRTGPLPAEEVRRLAREIGWALSYAHQRGVIHRDIKPENLLIDVSTNRYVIADFGIAQATDQINTPANGSVVGTARYMAPEQALGETVDGRADLYALGVTLFVAATGRAPFEGSSAMALVAQHASAPAPAVRSLAPSLPLSLARAIERCLAKSPADRFASAEALLAAVTPLERGEALSPALRGTYDHGVSVRNLLTWTVVIGATSTALVAGEHAGSIGRAILASVNASITSVLAFATLVRGGEALFEARRVLREGHDPQEVVRALVGDPAPTGETSDTRRGARASIAQVVIGLALAFLQGRATSIHLADGLNDVVQIVTLFVPPLLIARGLPGAVSRTPLGAWLRERIATPLARAATRLLLVGAPAKQRAAVADAPTEVLLLRAVASAVGGLSASQRAAVGDPEALARALAHQVAELRAFGLTLDEREAVALVERDSEHRRDALEQIARERHAAKARLQTAVAALESLRLDLLQLAANHAASGLTTQLEQLRDVQHRVDAAIDVRRLLDAPTPT